VTDFVVLPSLHEKSIIAMVIVIFTDFLAFVFRDTNKNGSQEHQFPMKKG
jgi:hypothetical protein